MPTYGLKVTSASNQTIIDSDEGLPHFIEVDSTTINGGNDYEVDYPTDFEFNKLVFARPTSSCMIMEAGNTGGTRGFYRSVPAAVVQLIKADVTTSNVSNFATGYGLNIFDGVPIGGTTYPTEANLLFSTNTSTALDIKSVGAYSDLTQEHTINVIIDSADPHYVLLPGSFRYYWTANYGGPFGGASITIEINRGYKFNYTGNHLDSIDVFNKFIYNGSPSPLSYGGGAFMIVKLRS